MRRLIAFVLILAILGFLTSRAIDWWNLNVNTPVSSTSHNVSFHIDPGEAPNQIGSDLYDLHLIRSTIAFDMYTRLTNAGPKFQAGSFVLSTNMSLSQIVAALQHGRPDEKRSRSRRDSPPGTRPKCSTKKSSVSRPTTSPAPSI